MTWPFGGLPLGGVFLGQADGPLLAAGPARRPAAAHGRRLGGRGRRRHRWSSGIRARRRASAWPPTRAPLILGGLVAPRPSSARWSPDGGPPVRSVSVGPRPGRRPARRRARQQVDPATVFAAQVRGHAGAARTRPVRLRWCCGPRTSSPSTGPLRGIARGPRSWRSWPASLHTTVIAGVTEPAGPHAFRNEIVAWGPDGRIVDIFEKVHRVPFGEYVPYRSLVSHLADLSACPDRRHPRPRNRAAPDTPPDRSGALVSFEVFYANRSHTSVRAGAELLIVPTNTSSYATVTGADPGGGGRRGAGRRDRPRSGPGRAHGLQHGGHPTRRRPPALRARPPPGADGHRAPAPWLHALRPLGRPSGPRRWPRCCCWPGGGSHAVDPATRRADGSRYSS